jgi:uncharacterized protein YbjT (DUF2867 family)
MRHLVMGGTGTVGSLVVEGLLKKGESVRVLTRDAGKAKTQPKGAASVVGDLANPDTYEAIFRDYDNRGPALRVEDRVRGGAQADTSTPDDPASQQLLPERPLVQGRDPQVRRVSPAHRRRRHLAGGHGHAGKTYTLAGPDPLTCEDCARAFSEALGRKVVYGGDDLEAWAKSNRAYMPAWAVYDYALMYAMFQKKGLKATPAQLQETCTIVGHEPRKFSDFVKETAASWK